MIKIKPMPNRFTSLSTQEIEDGIAKVTEYLKGPMPNIERQMAYADRVDLRAALVLMKRAMP